MKQRSRKHRLELRYAQVKSKNVPEVTVVEETPVKPCRAFDLLFKDITPIQELVDDDLDIVIEKKQRGRPRKYFPDAEVRDDKHTHKMDDDKAVAAKHVGGDTKLKMVEMFRYHYIVNQIPLQASLKRIEDAFKISHKQAHQILESEF